MIDSDVFVGLGRREAESGAIALHGGHSGLLLATAAIVQSRATDTAKAHVQAGKCSAQA